MISLREKEELTKLVRTVKTRVATNLGKIAALEYSKLEATSENEAVNTQEVIRKAIFRNSLISKNNVPLLLLKIDSYLSEGELKCISSVILDENLDGCIIGSTVPLNVGIRDKGKREMVDHVALGGIGGARTEELAKYALRKMYEYTGGKKLLVSSGGIFTGQDMYERMCLGANLVQIYSALAYRGPYVAKYILEEFCDILKENNEKAEDIIGKSYK